MKTGKGLAARVAERITSSINQNVNICFTGDPGTGKSYAAISLAIDVSKKVSQIKGGVASDYFNIERSMSVINVMDFFDVLDRAKQFNIVVFDDSGVGYSARRFMDVINITLNNIVETFRPLNLLTIFTTPQLSFIDRVGRQLLDFYIELDEVIPDHNFSSGRVFEIEAKGRLGTSGKLFYVYPRYNAEKNTRVLFKKPPDDICKKYEELRAKSAEEYKHKSIAELKAKKEEKNKKKERENKAYLLPKVKEEIKNGVSVRKACAKTGLSINSYYNLIAHEDI